MHVDHLIVGQGISGTTLSRALLQAGRSVMVIDDGNKASSSRVASGVVNPVTGKRLVKTWMIDELLPFAAHTYTSMEAELGVSLVKECSILDFHLTNDARVAFNDRQATDAQYLNCAEGADWDPYFRFNYGIGEIAPCLLIDLQLLLTTWRERLLDKGALLDEYFEWADCSIGTEGVLYKGISARNIIFCNGVPGGEHPFFNMLPWSKDKGEAILVSIPGLPADHIYKHGINIVPWQDGLFWVGATHDWRFTDMLPTEAFRKSVEEQLAYWLRQPFAIVDHLVSQRPANLERKPFVGLHPVHESVGIFNGMGSKGCSMAPYFAAQFAGYLANGSPLMPDVDVRRFSKILSR